ncbi:Predicted arabinose efflux permease, MFS family [Saccharopolyspora antimicrobica]|uniref:MFS family arabinose efflux permease n=1 Tax=Saccharopolyspora antimicrobica TaxID=455193 RepID=A0A1I5FR20_9PSEU|nr:MFS transporter [Saccharopolyspora antimicrobica]RKT82278.1 putative MFS family arabinose efflux permease [Saccharopolyspora antimicrobica]SFO26220.1 Predicted arabinose efflux permease, MFS family [Saccharopolyspora antimicrobica]
MAAAGQQRTVGTARVLSSVAAVVTVGVFPVFLVGGLGVQLQQEFGFGAALLGVGAAGFFGVASLSSRTMGWLVERIGSRLGMRVGALGSSACLFGMAAAPNAAWLLAVLWVAGLPNSLAQPASNLLIAQGIPVHRRGMGFGVKQSSIPAATLLAGVAVPAVALTVGWRWVFVIAGAIGLVAAAAVPRLPEAERTRSAKAAGGGSGPRRSALLLLAISGGLGSAAANALGAFVTTTAVEVGFSPSAAGLVLSLGSATGLLIRLCAGVVADRRNPDLVRVISGMLLIGSIGFGLMAVHSTMAFLIGVSIGFGAGWAWPGLLNFAVAKIAPDRVASATSFTQTGIYLGGSLGPLLFGLLAEHAGLDGAWLAAGAAAIVAGVLLLFIRR